MKRTAAIVLTVASMLPLSGCTRGGGQAAGVLAGLALSIGASVGSFLLIREIAD